jgi:hypothetical protein
MANIDITSGNYTIGFGDSSSGNRNKFPYYPSIISEYKGFIYYIFWFLI